MTGQDSDSCSEGERTELPRDGRLAGIDYGTVRMGIAVSDPNQILASPYENYARRSLELDGQYLQQLADRESIVGFVVGLPLHVSGDESEKSLEARKFGAWLAERTRRPVAFHDERYTSVDADAQLLAANLSKKRRKTRLDMLAAQMILRSFLEAR